MEWSLAQLWRSWGVEATALLGHSVGEYVAACHAGVMSLEDGLRLISARASLMQSLPPDGMMAALACDEETARAAVAPYASTAAIASVNGPRNVVISGRADTIKLVLEQLRSRRVSAVPLTVSHAFHSPLLNPILDSFERIAARCNIMRRAQPLVSNVTGRFAQQGEAASAAYWRRHAASPVRFADGIAELKRKGCQLFLEIGPTPVLANMGRQCLGDDGSTWLASLSKGRDDWTQLLDTLGELYVRGLPVDWSAFDRPYRRQRLALPTYPFQRKRFWFEKQTTADTKPKRNRLTQGRAGRFARLVRWCHAEPPAGLAAGERDPLRRPIVAC